MRPLRLELTGFTAFREPVEIDLTDAAYFAFVGPTGSGKSSIIDAMTFALFGSVARLDARSVAPVVSQGRTECRVRFDFAIGEETFSAVRVVRKTGPDRATTKEARLERGEESLAGDAEGVTAEVERLLGLNFDQFTRCVVLPQGEFARFLTDKPSERQDLLVRLLGLDVYERMASRANQRAVAADAQLVVQNEKLENIGSFASDEALVAARTQIGVLEALRMKIEDEEAELDALRDVVRAARSEEQRTGAALTALAKIAPPEGIERTASAVTEVRALIATLEAAAATADAEATAAEAALAALPDRAGVQRAVDAHARLDGLRAQRGAAETAAGTARATLEKAAATAADAEAKSTAAVAALEAAKLQHRAHELARELVAGEPCPVCDQPVRTLPARTTPARLTTAEKTAAATTKKARDAEAARAAAASDVAVASALLDDLDKQIAAATQAVEGFGDVAAARRAATEITAAEKAVTAARGRATQARGTLADARRGADQLDEQLRTLRAQLGAQRDAVAELGPPPLAFEDLSSEWTVLRGWAETQTAALTTARAAASERTSRSEREGVARVEAQRRACVEAGLDTAEVPRDACIKGIERLRGKADNIEMALDTAKQIREEIAVLTERAAVSRALAKYLRADAFEEWVLRQSLTTLVDGATQNLLELSGGQYSLSMDKHRNFSVVDHRNANMERSARTLSGGETFLASLSLALALSDRLAQLSANTAVRLESIFLDEGFGTLDDETLETVASALETLSSTHRIVGIVTHRRELAERIPLRFEVRKGAATSSVEKVLV